MAIDNYLDQILVANYGDEVRDSIVSALEACYADATGNPNSYNAAVKSLTDLYSSLYDEYSGKFNAIGTVVNAENNTSSVAVDASTYAKLASVTLTTGRWLIIYGGQWNANATGTRWMNINRDGDGPPGTTRYAITDMGNGTTINETRVVIYDITGEETLYLWGWQNSGGVLTCFPILTAIRIAGQEDSEEGSSDIREELASLTSDVSDAKQSVQDLNSSFTTLTQQHTEDIYSVREELAGNVQVLMGLIDDTASKSLIIDENDYLCFG